MPEDSHFDRAALGGTSHYFYATPACLTKALASKNPPAVVLHAHEGVMASQHGFLVLWEFRAGVGDGRAILRSLNKTAKRSGSGIRSGGCAILPTTAFSLKQTAAQVWLIGTSQEHLAHNNLARAQIWALETTSASPAATDGILPTTTL